MGIFALLGSPSDFMTCGCFNYNYCIGGSFERTCPEAFLTWLSVSVVDLYVF